MMVRQFLDYLLYERGYARLTAENYGKDLAAFCEFAQGLEGRPTLATADGYVVRLWVESMMDKGNAPATINRRLCALRTFYRFATRWGLVGHDPTKGVKGPKAMRPLPKFVREGDMSKLFDGGMEWGEGFTDVRDKAMLDVFYETGIRLSELIGLDDTGVDFALRQVLNHGAGIESVRKLLGHDSLDTTQVYVHTTFEQLKRVYNEALQGRNH